MHVILVVPTHSTSRTYVVPADAAINVGGLACGLVLNFGPKSHARATEEARSTTCNRVHIGIPFPEVYEFAIDRCRFCFMYFIEQH